jgi:hypothetical protein
MLTAVQEDVDHGDAGSVGEHPATDAVSDGAMGRGYVPDASVQAETSRACGSATAFLQAPARLATAVIAAPTTLPHHSEVPDRLT